LRYGEDKEMIVRIIAKEIEKIYQFNCYEGVESELK
jgi:hypothetical protein